MSTFVIDELELGKRAAILIGNEQEGWGPWVDSKRMFDMTVLPVDLHEEWLPHPHKPSYQRQPPRDDYHF